MLDMKNFEGIKKIENIYGLDIEYIYKILTEYKNEIGGTVEIVDNKKIIADVDGKYLIEIYLNSKHIIIERKIESNFEKENIELGTDLKSIDMAKADRMVDQIYDLLNTLSEDGKVLEPITGVKRAFLVNQKEGRIRDNFYVTTENHEMVYEIKGNKILKEFAVKNLISKRQDVSIQYQNYKLGQYTITKSPITYIKITKNNDGVKTIFTGKLNTKDILVTADYANNHYVVELNKIVIGAIDSLNDKTKDSYRIEINDLNYEYLIVALTVIIDKAM